MTKSITLTLAVSALALSGTAHAQILNQIMGKLLQPASATAPRTTEAPYRGPTNGGFVQPSPSQKEALERALAPHGQSAALAHDITDAKTILRRAIMASACATADADLDALNDVILEPKSHKNVFLDTNWYIGKSGMRYHDARQCVTVARTMKWNRLAANALSVDVYYISPSSNEAVHQTLKLRKMNDTGWLIDDIGHVFS
jgi:hypothetical protein